jgi:hypothetical protein
LCKWRRSASMVTSRAPMDGDDGGA